MRRILVSRILLVFDMILSYHLTGVPKASWISGDKLGEEFGGKRGGRRGVMYVIVAPVHARSMEGSEGWL